MAKFRKNDRFIIDVDKLMETRSKIPPPYRALPSFNYLNGESSRGVVYTVYKTLNYGKTAQYATGQYSENGTPWYSFIGIEYVRRLRKEEEPNISKKTDEEIQREYERLKLEEDPAVDEENKRSARELGD